MQTTVRICGVDYPDCELVQHGKLWGLKTLDKTFWLYPVCDENGNEINECNPIPLFVPREIRAVTVEVPDLTRRYPNAVKELFDKRLAYFTRTTTLDAYLKDGPGICNPPTSEQFEAGRKRILSESLEDFARDPFARQMVWHQYGTQELADQHGYLGAVCETEVSDDGTEHRVIRYACADALMLAIIQVRRWTIDAGWGPAEAIVGKLKYEMIYEGVPAPRFIYLEEMKEAAHPSRQPDAVLAVDVRAHVPTHSVKEVQLIMPGWEEALNTIERAEAVAAKLTAVAGEVCKATEIGDLYSNPSMKDAKDAAIKQEVPKEFVAYCHTEMHARKFPSTDQAHKAVQTQPLFRALRDPETPSRTTVWRWWRIIRNELESRGLLQPRGKGPSAQKAARYDVDRHAEPSPEPITLENAEREQERAGRTGLDSRNKELHDPLNGDPLNRSQDGD